MINPFIAVFNYLSKTLLYVPFKHEFLLLNNDEWLRIKDGFVNDDLINKRVISDELLSLAESFNYPNFLHSCLLIGYQQLFNSFYDKALVKRFIAEVKEEINNLIR